MHLTSGLWTCVWLLFIKAVVQPASAATKRWKRNTNYDNPDNWSSGRLPCANDHLVFPDSMPAVFVQANATVVEMILPTNGELVLGDFVSFTFPSTPVNDASCTGERISFTRTDSKSWFSPENWCETSGLDGNCLSSQPDVLETEQVPCKHDAVVFPANSKFRVDLSSDADIFVSSLLLDGQEQTTGSMDTYLKSAPGQQQFVRRSGNTATTINVRSNPCTDTAGCACGNDQGQILAKICANYDNKCPAPVCSGPLLPKGGCCQICGAVLKVDYSPGFRFDRMKATIQHDYTQDYDNVQLLMSKTSDERIQVVLKDTGEELLAAGIGQLLKDALQQDVDNQGRRYGVTEVQLQTSGGGPHTAHVKSESSSSLGRGTIVGIVVAAFLLLLVLMLAILCYTARRTIKDRLKLPSIPLPFKRFGSEPREEGGEQFSDNISLGDASVRSLHSIQGFENPTYDQPYSNGQRNGTASDGDLLDLSDVSFTKTEPTDLTTSFFNPMYKQTDQNPYLDATVGEDQVKISSATTVPPGKEQDSTI